MDISEATMMAKEEPRAELFDRLSSELDRYERAIGMTEALLNPILLQYDSPPPGLDNLPQEAPMHKYHAALTRLENLNYRFEELRSRIRL